LRIGVLRESAPGETRVALTPDAVARLRGAGHEVWVQGGAGGAAGFPDEAYAAAGARIGPGLPGEADAILKVAPPDPVEARALAAGQLLVSFLFPAQHAEAVAILRERGVRALALEALPRSTRAQAMDALSSMSTIAGYKAALLAADHCGRLFPMLMTAAGTIPPARVLVVGAGVAGLQAIATARRLGALVEAFDIRPAAREEARSLGASFLEIDVGEGGQDRQGYAVEISEAARERQRAAMREAVRRADAVIATALVPGRPAPRLVTGEMAAAMAPGSVIVDLAAPSGGNCEWTRPGETIVRNGVTVLGPLNVPAMMPLPASRLLARNFTALLEHVAREGRLLLDPADEIVRATLLLP